MMDFEIMNKALKICLIKRITEDVHPAQSSPLPNMAGFFF